MKLFVLQTQLHFSQVGGRNQNHPPSCKYILELSTGTKKSNTTDYINLMEAIKFPCINVHLAGHCESIANDTNSSTIKKIWHFNILHLVDFLNQGLTIKNVKRQNRNYSIWNYSKRAGPVPTTVLEFSVVNTDCTIHRTLLQSVWQYETADTSVLE
jgi:hypothetical protein